MHIDLRLAAILTISAANSHAADSQKSSLQRPNIIYIMSDDHAYQAISAYGGPLKDLAPTPYSVL